jgi:hypothetical protein
VRHVILAQPGAGGPVRRAARSRSSRRCRTNLRPVLDVVHRERSESAEGAIRVRELHGVPGRAGHRACLLADGEVIDGEPAFDRGRSGLGLIAARCPAGSIAARRSPVP